MLKILPTKAKLLLPEAIYNEVKLLTVSYAVADNYDVSFLVFNILHCIKVLSQVIRF